MATADLIEEQDEQEQEHLGGGRFNRLLGALFVAIAMLGGVAAGALLMVGSQAAYAAPGTCTSTAVLTAGGNFGGVFTVNGGGTTVSSGGVTYNCIQQQDKLFSNFTFGQLPPTGTATLNFTTVGSWDL